MKRKIGATSWIFGSTDIPDIASRMKQAGLDGVEFNPDEQAANGRDVARIFNDFGLSVLSLTPPDVDLTHPDLSIRTAALDVYYRVIEFAAASNCPVVSCHGLVGRITPIASKDAEDAWLVESVSQICDRAQQAGVKIVFEVLNRYETHQIRTCTEALDLAKQVRRDNFAILLDAYHMNIEEANPAEALNQAGPLLGLYHAADSNREAPGMGHTDFQAQFRALDAIGYQGPVVMEINAPGPNPFNPDKGDGFRDIVMDYLARGVSSIRQYEIHSKAA